MKNYTRKMRCKSRDFTGLFLAKFNLLNLLVLKNFEYLQKICVCMLEFLQFFCSNENNICELRVY